jgi:hypothetical protein
MIICYDLCIMALVKVEQHSFLGGIWMIGWLFSIGFLHLMFWQAVIGILIWPYYLGSFLSFLGR